MKINRRTVLSAAGAGLLAANSGIAVAAPNERLFKAIPKTGETIPAIGMGTWLTFSIGKDQALLAAREKVLREFFAHGGGMIDSSPMYRNSEEVIGTLLNRLKQPKTFSATKVWTPIIRQGPAQVRNSRTLWQIPNKYPLDLVHVHNLLQIEQHLPMLRKQKSQGNIRYIGMTTSHGRRHADLETFLKKESVDFVQFTYNILDRNVENRLLPAALDNGVAVVINRPFRTGLLFRKLSSHKLPGFAAEIGCGNWAQFMLKFIISHPAVTCAIPATTRVDHMRQNMEAGLGSMPDAKLRANMAGYVDSLI